MRLQRTREGWSLPPLSLQGFVGTLLTYAADHQMSTRHFKCLLLEN